MSHQRLEYAVSIDLSTLECCICGVVFAVPDELRKKRLEDGQSFWCPAGHGQCFTESAAKRIKALELEGERLRRAREQLKREKDQLENDLLDEVKKRQRLEKRVHNGTCPHCRRHFVNLERHMQTKHSGAA